MNNFVTTDSLRDFAFAVSAVVAVTNLVLLLVGESARKYAKLVAFVGALAIAFAATGLPKDFATGVTTFLNAVFVFLAASGGNGTIVDALANRQPQARGLLAVEAPVARFWRRW